MSGVLVGHLSSVVYLFILGRLGLRCTVYQLPSLSRRRHDLGHDSKGLSYSRKAPVWKHLEGLRSVRAISSCISENSVECYDP